MRIGIDLGGTKTSGILIDSDGAILARVRLESPRGHYRATLDMLKVVADRLAGPDHPHQPVGIGIPGSISPATGLVKNANSTWLIGHPLAEDAARHLHRPVRIANDADCFALSEAVDGAAVGSPSVFGVILGTGVGAGIVVRGGLLSGPNAIAGEWGHNPLPWADPERDPALPCYCGQAGCIETYLSGPGLKRHHKLDTGEDISPEIIAQGKTPERRASIATYSDRLARALAHVINILDPHAIVLGGGLSEIGSLYHTVPEIWAQYVFSDTVATPLLKQHHGADSGVRGAAWLWPATPYHD